MIAYLMKKNLLLPLFLITGVAVHCSVQAQAQPRTIQWNTSSGMEDTVFLSFREAFYSDEDPFYPLYYESFYAGRGYQTRVEVTHTVFEVVAPETLPSSLTQQAIPATFSYETSCGIQRNQSVTSLYINPFIIDQGIVYRLTHFTLLIRQEETARAASQFYDIQSSPLAEGNWYKFYLYESGMYALRGSDLQQQGIDIASINPDNLAVFGNGGEMLAEPNAENQNQGLREIAILVEDGNDGSFDPEDYLVFYGEGPRIWRFNPAYYRYTHSTHVYSDKTACFLTVKDTPGKRIQSVASVNDSVTHKDNRYQKLYVHEEETVSLVKSGKNWFGHSFSPNDTSFTLDDIYFPAIDTTSPVMLITEFVGRSISDDCSFFVSYNDSIVSTSQIRNISPTDNSTFARSKSMIKKITPSADDSIVLNIEFQKGNNTSRGWIDFIELHGTCFLHFTGRQFRFHNLDTYGYEQVTEFSIHLETPEMQLWDISDFHNPVSVQYEIRNDSAVFVHRTDVLHEYIAFNGSDYLTPEWSGKMENQNLYDIDPVDYLIITHPDFYTQARRLADFHEAREGFSTLIVTPGKIYNEFSSGIQDVTAIRDFIRMMYLQSEGKQPAHVLLMGDGSYDYKDRLSANTNFVPAFQSEESLRIGSSWVTDDYYALMDENEGDDAFGLLDIGVGRFPVSTPGEADMLIDKIEHYLSPTPSNQQPWKNSIVFIGDDEDSNLHFIQVETLTSRVSSFYPRFNIQKIYFDAYQRIAVSGGYRFPDAKTALWNAVEQGALIVNYTGHGGETGWGNENVLEIPDINAWTNYDHMSVFITATCAFSRFDNPEKTSAGELVIMNPNGGAVAMLTTSRISFATMNFTLNQRIYDIALRRTPEGQPTLGDIMQYAKVPHYSSTKNFVIFGDPALPLALPSYTVTTDEVLLATGIQAASDTVRALDTFVIHGSIRDSVDKLVSGFSGSVNIRVFDKPSVYSTLGQAPASLEASFTLQDKLLFDGLAQVINGRFSAEILIPKEINYAFGKGKISYYAIDSLQLSDAAGSYDSLIIGGYNAEAMHDFNGPVVSAYMNNTDFITGDITNENPVLLVELSDPCGINAIGSSIGHDLIAWLDDRVDQIIPLNPYYSPAPGLFHSGRVIYPFHGLSEGLHTLTVKAWDMCNNSTQTTIDFWVSSTLGVEISNLKVTPNPFASFTSLTFLHNMPGRTLEVIWEIFDATGRNIRTIENTTYCESTAAGPFFWDGLKSNGDKAGSGVYPFRISIRSNTGQYTLSGGTLLVR
ncbi:MAG: type IX secretion system sortase PorU [Bacteroidia bacterium]|nr:type IX secretion system sortase PorU [Bacteroidia bacterium]